MVYLDAVYSYAYYNSFRGDLHIELLEVRWKLEEMQAQATKVHKEDEKCDWRRREQVLGS